MIFFIFTNSPLINKNKNARKQIDVDCLRNLKKYLPSDLHCTQANTSWSISCEHKLGAACGGGLTKLQCFRKVHILCCEDVGKGGGRRRDGFQQKGTVQRRPEENSLRNSVGDFSFQGERTARVP